MKVIIGYGTGRCGTQSLARFLNNQNGCDITHEKVELNWQPAFSDVQEAINGLFRRTSPIIGDVGFFWIHYLTHILREVKDAKAINIWREDEAVIESFWSYMKKEVQNFQHNQWKGYPFDSPFQTKDAIAKSVMRYRFLEHGVSRIYPYSIYKIHTNDLNDKDKMEEMLNWLGIKDMNLKTFHSNTSKSILAKQKPFAKYVNPFPGFTRRLQ